MGNSEVGHMNLGAGRIVNQDIQRIDASIEGGLLDKNPALSSFISALKSSGGTCHLLGLLSPGGVHSHQRHLLKLAEILSIHDIPVAVHAFLDGRDTRQLAAVNSQPILMQRCRHAIMQRSPLYVAGSTLWTVTNVGIELKKRSIL